MFNDVSLLQGKNLTCLVHLDIYLDYFKNLMILRIAQQ